MPGRLGFRALSADDMQQLFLWLLRPHVAKWYAPAPSSFAEVVAKYRPRTEPGNVVRAYVIELEGAGVGYIDGRETRDFGDIARALAARIARACDSGAIALERIAPREGIRATVIVASQFTVQVSGKTIHVSDERVLPLRNVPVIAPAIGAEFTADSVARSIAAAMERSPVEAGETVALALRWRGDPEHARLLAMAQGIAKGLPLPWERAGVRGRLPREWIIKAEVCSDA